MRTFVLTLFAIALPALASAQVCPYGLVAVDPTHCCWPGQTYAPDRGTCAGAPQCPAGLTAYGETCVAAPGTAPGAQPVDPTVPPPPPPAAGYVPQAMPPQVFGYPVRFEAKKSGNEFTVSVDKGVACRTPCELTVPPGRHRVHIEGDARFSDSMTFPASPTTILIEKRRGGGVALGVVGLAVGIPATVVGGLVGLVGYALNTSSSSTNRNTGKTMMYAGFGVGGAGLVLLVVGTSVGFSIAGHDKLTFARASVDEPEPPVRLVGLGVVPTAGGAMGGATFAF